MPSVPRLRRIYYQTFGCRANQYDTERTRQFLELRGCETVSDLAHADAVVVNSCTVTANADSELRRYIRGVGRRLGRNVPVVVVGCATAVAAEAIRGLRGVTGVVPGQDPAAVAANLGLARLPESPDSSPLERCRRGTRAWLKVQDGCDLNCSYCVIRLARGRSRSRTPPEIIEEAHCLSEEHPEISLTGIHIGLYGKDLRPRTSLAALVESLLTHVPNVRFRIGSLECNQLDDRVIELMAESGGRLAPHLHVPLQSGSDRVLRAMRRAYTSGRFEARVERLCARVWPLGLGTDVIVGFPGETDEDHRRTVDLISALPFTYIHVFPYSERSGTDAERLADPVVDRVKRARSQEIRELVRGRAAEYRHRRVGGRAMVVLEGERMEGAVTGDYLKMEASDSLRANGFRLQPALIETDGNAGLRATAYRGAA